VSTHEREITAPVDLTRADGTLAPEAIGWSRTPLHRGRLPGPRGRRKRWDYWCVSTREIALQITVADLDYLGLVEVSVVDRTRGRIASAPRVVPLALGIRLPEEAIGGTIRAGGVTIEGRGGATRIAARARTLLHGILEADVSVEPAKDSLNVVIPWSTKEFQLTSKQVALPATGHVRAFGRTFDLAGGFACLDFGRGVWPKDTIWNWGVGAGVVAGRTIGLQLGGAWTRGTGATENGVFVDGELDKIGEELDWEYDREDWMRPWRVRGGGLDLEFRPTVLREPRIELGFARSELHLGLGAWSGEVRAHGETFRVDELLGWAEEHRARW